jgi:acyl-CoA synthetase (NDP forming)
VPAEIDLAIVVTAAANVEGNVREALAAGIRSFVVFSSGFAEFDAQGVAMQARLATLVSEAGATLIGPNCLGVINSENSLCATFTTAIDENPVRAGSFSFVSQSGALAAYWLDLILQSGGGFSKWVSTGNEACVNLAEVLDYLVDDPATEVIGAYIEDIKDPERFRRALRRAAEQAKPIIVIKAGRSQAGAIAAASHTGALAGEDASYDAFFRQFGAQRVYSVTVQASDPPAARTSRPAARHRVGLGWRRRVAGRRGPRCGHRGAGFHRDDQGTAR